MGTSNNPYRPGDRVTIPRGDGWLAGTVVKTILARTFVQVDDRVFVDDWHLVKPENECRLCDRPARPGGELCDDHFHGIA